MGNTYKNKKFHDILIFFLPIWIHFFFLLMFKFWRVIKKVIFNWLLLPLFMYSQHNIVFQIYQLRLLLKKKLREFSRYSTGCCLALIRDAD